MSRLNYWKLSVKVVRLQDIIIAYSTRTASIKSGITAPNVQQLLDMLDITQVYPTPTKLQPEIQPSQQTVSLQLQILHILSILCVAGK